MTPKFMTAKGAGLASGQPYYIGHVQHDRAMSIALRKQLLKL